MPPVDHVGTLVDNQEPVAGPLLFTPICSANERRVAFEFRHTSAHRGDGPDHCFADLQRFEQWLGELDRTRAYLVFADGRMIGWYAVRQLNPRAGYRSSAELYLDASRSTSSNAADRILLHAASAARTMGFHRLVLGSSRTMVAQLARSFGRVAGSVSPLHLLQLDLFETTAVR